MGLAFFVDHGAERTLIYPAQHELDPVTESEEELGQRVDLTYEVGAAVWRPISPRVEPGFRPCDWSERPRRFIDGRDIGEIIATLRSEQGYPIPVRLSQIGAAVLSEQDGHLRRTNEVVQRVVTLVGDPFPWTDLESLAVELQRHGFHLLLARLPKVDDQRALYDFEVMRKVTNNRSQREMAALEESMTGREDSVATLIDGYLEKRFGRANQNLPLIGVVKSHWRNYLDAGSMQTLYQLQPGQRTPAFLYKTEKYPVVSFYLRLAAGMPNWGLVRVELPHVFFERAREADPQYLDKLSFTLFDYRCRQESYGRQPVSLQPIVSVEQRIGALLSPPGRLTSHFYRIANL